MANPSNLLPDDSSRIQDFKYLYASNANVSNFVSVKLSGNNNYHLWKTQMICLMESHNMHGFVDPNCFRPKALSREIEKQYDSLLKGWIFGSVSEGVLGTVVNLGSAKDVWDKLKSFCDSTMFFPQDSTQTKVEVKEETKDKDVSREIETEKDTNSVEVNKITRNKKDTNSVEVNKITRNNMLRIATIRGRWFDIEDILREEKDAMTAKLNSDGNTILHIAVGIFSNFFVKELLSLIEPAETLLELKSLDGSTALHVAAIVGNKYAAQKLVERHKGLLTIKDNQGEEPLLKACSNMHFETFMYLWNAANDNEKSMDVISCGPHIEKGDNLLDAPHIEKGVNLLVNAISAKKYREAKQLVEKFPIFARTNDEVMMAIAKTFPSGLNYWERFIYPSLDDIHGRITKRSTELVDSFKGVATLIFSFALICPIFIKTPVAMIGLPIMVLYVLMRMLILVYVLIKYLIILLVLMVYFPFFMIYFLSWKVATSLAVPPVKHIVDKYKEREEAKEILKLVCNEIDKLKPPGAHHSTYNRSILEAARQNVFEVIDEILSRSPEAIQCTNKSGYDIIQLAIIHRSEKIYNLIHCIEERKNRYRTFKDTSGNNILHLAGRLAPPKKLNSRTGAALQLQRELQWHEELKALVFPSYITEENIYKETPTMVFTREHEHLVKEGENWMKTTAESCSITAALITTIVFAAAITVPGGSNQDTGTPLFSNDIAFIIFAISDAVSLFTSSTSLLVFLSILTTRFAEQDFLVRLPRRLIIGLCTLFLSTTAMMVAFSATLFLVFCDKKPWMLAPICGLACLPIVFFVTLQFPLIVDLVRSTYVPIFGNNYQGRFDPDEVQGFFGISHHGKFTTMVLGKGKAEALREQRDAKQPPMVQVETV